MTEGEKKNREGTHERNGETDQEVLGTQRGGRLELPLRIETLTEEKKKISKGEEEIHLLTEGIAFIRGPKSV